MQKFATLSEKCRRRQGGSGGTRGAVTSLGCDDVRNDYTLLTEQHYGSNTVAQGEMACLCMGLEPLTFSTCQPPGEQMQA